MSFFVGFFVSFLCFCYDNALMGWLEEEDASREWFEGYGTDRWRGLLKPIQIDASK
jgi:hypothetical protein